MSMNAHILTAAIPDELRLLAACCDAPVSAETIERLKQLAQLGPDWRVVARAAHRHQVQGFVHDRIGHMQTIPPDLREKWHNQVRLSARINLNQARVTGDLHALLNDSGVPNIVLKGLPLSAQLYGSLTIKRSSDIDLLVRPAHAWTAVKLLAEQGFLSAETGKALTEKQITSVVRHFKEITLRGKNNIIVDLHWRMIENSGILAGLDAFLAAQSVTIENVGEIAVLGKADAFAYLCAHGALSDWSRLKWLADVNALLGESSDTEIEALYEHAKRLGAGPCALQALGLRELFWPKSMPQSVKAELAEIDQTEFLAFPIERMKQPYKPASSRDALRRIGQQTRVRSILYGSSSDAIGESGNHFRALPDVLALPLPPGLDWLYFPLRPIFWTARKLRG